ncbi:SMP-30/gluconolactonase/LRE family protein [Microbacterium tumbae]
MLAEGPVWDADTGLLSWVDIDDGLVLSAPLRDGRLGAVTTRHVGGSVGSAVPLADGSYLLALEAWLGLLDADGVLRKSRALIPTNRRLNDGKIDPQGRFVVGSLRRWGGPDGKQHLLRLEHDGALTVLDDDLNLSNGMGWSPDGTLFYHADSADRVIYRRSYSDGRAGRREAFLALDGMPDGMTVDADGRLWITLIDRCRIECYSPEGDRLLERTIELGGLHPASVEFAGESLEELIVTTGAPRLEDAAADFRIPGDGVLLSLRPGVCGLRRTPWAPAPLPQEEVPVR